MDNNVEDRTDSDEESFTSEDENGDGEVDSIHSSEISENPSKYGKSAFLSLLARFLLVKLVIRSSTS